MMLRIGNRNTPGFTPLEIHKTVRKRKFLTGPVRKISNRAGFTLIEIMVTTVILSLAAVLIYETFFRSMDLLNYCCDYLKVTSWVDDKMWQAQNELVRFNAVTEAPTNYLLTLDNKNFNWNLSYLSAGYGAPNLYRIEATLSWQEGRKDMHITRIAYARYDGEKEE